MNPSGKTLIANSTGQNLQKKWPNATLASLLACATLLSACGSAPPAVPRQIQEYSRHSAVGFEKHQDGFIGESRNAFLRALARAEMDDDAQLIATALLNIGASELLLDNVDEAVRTYGRANREAELAGSISLRWQALSGLAEATRRQGQPTKALELFAARPELIKPQEPALHLAAEVSRARALADNGQPDTALGLVNAVIDGGKNRPAPDAASAAAWHAKASLLLSTGKHQDAMAAASAALDLDRAIHHPPSVAEDHRLLAKIAASQNANDTQRHHLQRALAIFANTGQKKRAAECRNALQKLKVSQ